MPVFELIATRLISSSQKPSNQQAKRIPMFVLAAMVDVNGIESPIPTLDTHGMAWQGKFPIGQKIDPLNPTPDF